MKYLVLTGFLLLTGCGSFYRFSAHITGYQRECVAGVYYLQFPSGATVEYTEEGKVKTCKE